MATPEELEELMLAPKRTTTEEGTVEERDLKDIIAADAYNSQKDQGTPWGIRIARSKPNGTVPPSSRYP